MRVPNHEHTARPWRIHELAPGFRVEDVWRLPVAGDRRDFPRLVQLFTSLDPADSSAAVRALVTVRSKFGKLFGWDDPASGGGSAGATIRGRLPEDLRHGPTGPTFDALPFRSLYLTEDEWAAETANRTMHGMLHVGWVPDEAGGFRGEMAVYVKPNGLFGRAYMAAIKPFRYLIVYPRLMRAIERAWREGAWR